METRMTQTNRVLCTRIVQEILSKKLGGSALLCGAGGDYTHIITKAGNRLMLVFKQNGSFSALPSEKRDLAKEVLEKFIDPAAVELPKSDNKKKLFVILKFIESDSYKSIFPDLFKRDDSILPDEFQASQNASLHLEKCREAQELVNAIHWCHGVSGFFLKSDAKDQTITFAYFSEEERLYMESVSKKLGISCIIAGEKSLEFGDNLEKLSPTVQKISRTRIKRYKSKKYSFGSERKKEKMIFTTLEEKCAFVEWYLGMHKLRPEPTSGKANGNGKSTPFRFTTKNEKLLRDVLQYVRNHDIHYEFMPHDCFSFWIFEKDPNSQPQRQTENSQPQPQQKMNTEKRTLRSVAVEILERLGVPINPIGNKGKVYCTFNGQDAPVLVVTFNNAQDTDPVLLNFEKELEVESVDFAKGRIRKPGTVSKTFKLKGFMGEVKAKATSSVDTMKSSPSIGGDAFLRSFSPEQVALFKECYGLVDRNEIKDEVITEVRDGIIGSFIETLHEDYVIVKKSAIGTLHPDLILAKEDAAKLK